MLFSRPFHAISTLAVIFFFTLAGLSSAAPIRIGADTTPSKRKHVVVLGAAHHIDGGKKYLGATPEVPDYEALGRISARSAFIMDAKTGLPLYEKSADTPRQPASTIKVLTALLAMDAFEGQEYVAVSKKAARQPRSKIYLDRRKQYRAEDLINAVLLASANDASVALAECIAGNEQDFARKMTDKAKQMGAVNTVCKTASGLTAKGQRSTARDLAMIFNSAMENEKFAQKMARNKVRTSYGQTLHSHNKALWQIKSSLGGKTGYTNLARQTYVGKFKQGDAEIVIAIMGSERMWKDVKKLVRHGLSKKLSLINPEEDEVLPLAEIELAGLAGNSSS